MNDSRQLGAVRSKSTSSRENNAKCVTSGADDCRSLATEKLLPSSAISLDVDEVDQIICFAGPWRNSTPVTQVTRCSKGTPVSSIGKGSCKTA